MARKGEMRILEKKDADDRLLMLRVSLFYDGSRLARLTEAYVNVIITRHIT